MTAVTSFADEILAAAHDPLTRNALTRILRRWGGSRVYVRRIDKDAPRADAARMLTEHMARSDVVAVITRRYSMSERQARRIVADAMVLRGQEMAA